MIAKARVPSSAAPAALLLVLLVVAGCDRQRIRSYQAPKDQPTPADTASMADARPAQVKWRLPDGWQELPPSQMRVGNFAITGPNDQKAQVSIIPLPGQAGGELENANRWRGQVGLPRVSEAEMAKLAENVQIAGTPARMFAFSGVPPDETRPTRLLAATAYREGMAWFFKMVGDDALVAAQKAKFVEFLKGISF